MEKLKEREAENDTRVSRASDSDKEVRRWDRWAGLS